MKRQLEPDVSYENIQPDIGGVILTVREGDTMRFPLHTARRLLADLTTAIADATTGTNRLARLVDPRISDDEAALLLTIMDASDRGPDRIRCGVCYCTPHRSECVTCGCDGRRP